MDKNEVKTKIEELKAKLGNKFVYLIGHNMTYLKYILEP